ncbi:MAG: carboxypeptidase-like regulatory domain-containing protein [Pyrinomonadaceae bacterium]
MLRIDLKRKAMLYSGFLLLLSLAAVTSLSAQTGLKGKVRTNAGLGIANASVTVRKGGKDLRSVSSNNGGNFVIEGIEPGSYSLVVDAKGYSSGVLYNVEVKKNKLRDLGDRLILNVDQGSQVIVRGSVFFREGTSITGAKVEIERINSDGSTSRIGATFTNVSGEFTVRQPEASAKFRVTATYKGVTGTKEIQVENAAVYRLAITLDISRADK